ncbi:MAG: hypothetical protein V3T72_08975 [Thermoanaerobaculia bacterium]
MKKMHFVLAAVLVCSAVAAWALTPIDVGPAPTENPIPLLEEMLVPAGEVPITCTFNCADGFGFLLYCEDETLGECCQHGGPACSEHGGLVDGICKKGRLGLPCTGI